MGSETYDPVEHDTAASVNRRPQRKILYMQKVIEKFDKFEV